MVLGPEFRIEASTVFRHGQATESSRSATERTARACTCSRARGGVFGFADGVMLGGDAGRVVVGVLRPNVGRQVSDHDHGPARSLGEGGRRRTGIAVDNIEAQT